MMKIICGLTFSIFVLLFSCTSSVEKSEKLSKQPTEAPYFYYFERNGQATVKNTGQSCRNLLLQNFEILVQNLAKEDAKPIAFEDLYKYYDNHKKTISDSIWTAVDMPLVYTTIKDISPVRDFKGRLYTAYAKDIHPRFEQWCKQIAENSKDSSKLGNYTVYIDEETGHDLLQMFTLTGLGGILWSHGLHQYFKKVETDYNDSIVTFPGVNWLHYTWMEHHLDEAFGYYGAAARFHDFTNEEVADYAGGKNYKDNVERDGKLDFKTEYNFIFARLAATRDLTSQTSTNFSRLIFDAFYEARVAIVEKNYSTLIARKAIILDNWEKVVAATAVHHLNAVIKEMATLQEKPTTSPAHFYKHWSAMFTYTEMLRYNYANRFSVQKMVLQTKYVNPKVPFPKAIVDDISKIEAYTAVLLEVRGLFQSVYHFAEVDVTAW